MATAPTPSSADPVDEIDEIFRNAGTRPTVVDSQRAMGSDMMGDSVRQDSGTTDSFTFVNGATEGGSANSADMSPNANTPNRGAAAASSGQQPATAPASNNASASAQAPGSAMNAQAQTFAPVGAPSPAPLQPPLWDPSGWQQYQQQLIQQQQYM